MFTFRCSLWWYYRRQFDSGNRIGVCVGVLCRSELFSLSSQVNAGKAWYFPWDRMLNKGNCGQTRVKRSAANNRSNRCINGISITKIPRACCYHTVCIGISSRKGSVVSIARQWKIYTLGDWLKTNKMAATTKNTAVCSYCWEGVEKLKRIDSCGIWTHAGYPNRFRVYRLNRSAKLSAILSHTQLIYYSTLPSLYIKNNTLLHQWTYHPSTPTTQRTLPCARHS